VTASKPLAISLRNVDKRFGSTTALDSVTFEVAPGECHALLGRNGAGKSTLISILSGLAEPDRGDLQIGHEAGGGGLACVYQSSTLVPELTAAENICLGDFPTDRVGRIRWKEVHARASALLHEWNFAHIAERRVAALDPLERKVVEICRALAKSPGILLLDEPTAGLDDAGCRRLFDQLARARARGVTVVYVSHHLDEIFEVCDAVTILRDGRNVHRCNTSEIDVRGIVELMAGEAAEEVEQDARAGTSSEGIGGAVLEVESLTVGRLHGIDFFVRAGEAVGLAGLEGAGHVQLAQALAGQLAMSTGDVRVDGRSLGSGDPRTAIDMGIGFVPEDRHISGFVPWLSVEENSTMSIWHRMRNAFGFINQSARLQRFENLSREWSLKTSGARQPVAELSGGNQQKAVLVRALAADPAALVLINPTAGVDVTAKASIYRSLQALQDGGSAIVIASTDEDDLRMCDRVLVLYRQTVVAELERGWTDQALIAAIHGGTAP
jgi:simple sugar transport system ATP-binding protein